MKNRFLPICTSAALLLAGCAVEEASMEGGSIAAVMEDIQTRTAVTDEGTFTWSSGDQVWLEITANPGYVTGTLSSGAGTGSANFSYGTYFGDMTGKAVYPFNAGHDINGDELSVVLPASYDLGTNLSNTNAAMYGVETGGNIKFNHLAGVMRFKFRNAPAGTDRFILTLDKKINGTFTADLTEDHPVLRTESTSSVSEKSITLNFDPLTSAQDILLYVPLPLGTYTTLGLEVKAGSQSVWSYSNTVTNTISRKSLILMPTVTLAGSISGDIEGSETPDGSQNGDYIDEYGINHGQGVEIDGVVWAPVNCGYHATDYKYGKLYQWGRKYGQGYEGELYDVNGNVSGTYSDASVPSIVSGPVSLSTGQSESNSNKFYQNTSTPYDWVTPQEDALWNNGNEDNPVKTEYDPCPDGWRVPTYAELNALRTNKSSWTVNDDQNGYWFSGSEPYQASASSVFFPAAGGRYNGDGTAIHRGDRGFFWSSTPNSHYAFSLCLYSDNASMGNYGYDNRAHGFSIRCVREDSALDVPVEPSEPDPSQPSYSLQLSPSAYGWQQSTTVANPDPSVYDGVYESTNQGVDNTKSVMYIDINGYQNFTFYIRSNAESKYDYVEVSDLDADISGTGTSGIKVTTNNNQNPGTSLSAYTAVRFTGIDGGQHRIMVTYRKDSSQSHNDDKGYILIPKDQENRVVPDSGLEENVEFNPNYCIYYKANITGGWDEGYNNYRATRSHIQCNAGGTTVEMKFRLNTISGYSNFNLAADSNLAKDYCDSFEVDQYGLYLLVGTEDDWTTYNWKWSEIGVNYTDLITLRFSGEDETLNINGVELSCEGLRSMGWTYIFSSYYREYDEGEWKEYEGVPEGSELYYVKMYDSNGELTYLGYAAKAMNPESSEVEYCWYSSANGVESYQFANDAANQGGYSGNF